MAHTEIKLSEVPDRDRVLITWYFASDGTIPEHYSQQSMTARTLREVIASYRLKYSPTKLASMVHSATLHNSTDRRGLLIRVNCLEV
jgi:hypothetical protein